MIINAIGYGPGPLVINYKYTNPTSYNSSYASNTLLYPTIVGLRFRITTGSPGTIYEGISYDGLNWWEFSNQAVGDFITADQVGFFQNFSNGQMAMQILSYSETSP
jgi:hypothetical protein